MSEDEDPLVAGLRRFMRTYAEHDPDCPGFDASGPAALDPAVCTCGLMIREEELLGMVAERLKPN